MSDGLKGFGRALREATRSRGKDKGAPAEVAPLPPEPAAVNDEDLLDLAETGETSFLGLDTLKEGPRRPPDDKQMLFCVGAQKAGTTWLSAHLGRHPDCHFAHYKEMHYFDVMHGDLDGMIKWQINILKTRTERLYKEPRPKYRRKLDAVQRAAEMLDMYRLGPAGERAYVRLLLRGAGEARYLCDFTPDYAYMPADVFQTMAGFGVRPRFIFILRDPVSRFWSQIRMRLGRMDLTEEQRLPKAHAMVEEWLDEGPLSKRAHNDYAHTIAMLEAHVPAEDRIELFMDELFDQATLDRLTTFLGIAPLEADFTPEHVGAPLELPDPLRARIRESLDETYQFVAARYPGRLPARWAWNG